jgi:histidinol-phosphate/aromatic aminotransferase/cobyric acid decarboxylase-like protein
MHIAPFAIEEFFARYEFTTPHHLCASDCETLTVAELLALAGMPLPDLAGLRLGYTESQGHPELRAAVAGTYGQVTPEQVVMLAAPEEGIYLGMRTLLEPGDEVVVLAPAYESLLNVAEHICGAENVKKWWIQPAAGGWRLDVNELERLVTPKTRLLVVNFPHNPTGYLPSQSEFTAVLDIARRHNTWLFFDEMYRGLELGGRQTLPSAADRYERSLVLAGLSKVHGLPGLRCGWLVIHDEEVRGRFINWKHYTTICAPGPSELLALAGLRAQGELIRRNRQLIEANLESAEGFFARWPELFTWRRPFGHGLLSRPGRACRRLAPAQQLPGLWRRARSLRIWAARLRPQSGPLRGVPAAGEREWREFSECHEWFFVIRLIRPIRAVRDSLRDAFMGEAG